MYTLVKFQKNWGDEFNCAEFIILGDSSQEVQKNLNQFIKANPETSFGSNQSFFNFEQSDFSIQEITDEEADVLEKLLSNNFGLGILDNIFVSCYWREDYDDN